MIMVEEVRIDKFLWAIRAFKTRTDATDACKGGKIRLNGNDVKPSRAVKEGDTITVRKGAALFTYRVVVPVEKRQGAKLVPQFAENLTPQSELDKLRAPVETFFLKRDRGTGRPTKKDRREMETLWNALDFSDLPGDVAGKFAEEFGLDDMEDDNMEDDVQAGVSDSSFGEDPDDFYNF